MNKINLRLIRVNPLSLPVFIGKEMGIFEKHGVEINLGVDEKFLFDGNPDFYEGKADAMMGDIVMFFEMLEKGKDAIITSNLTRTMKLVGKNYPENFKGLIIGTGMSPLVKLYVQNDLNENFKNAKTVKIKNSYDRVKALLNGEVHALSAIEPFISDVLEKGGEVIWDSRNSNSNLLMWCFDREFYTNNRELVIKFHEALEEVQEIFNNSSEDEKVRLAIECGKYDTNMANRMRNFDFEKQDNFKAEDFEISQQWMFKNKEITKLYDTNKILADIF